MENKKQTLLTGVNGRPLLAPLTSLNSPLASIFSDDVASENCRLWWPAAFSAVLTGLTESEVFLVSL